MDCGSRLASREPQRPEYSLASATGVLPSLTDTAGISYTGVRFVTVISRITHTRVSAGCRPPSALRCLLSPDPCLLAYPPSRDFAMSRQAVPIVPAPSRPLGPFGL